MTSLIYGYYRNDKDAKKYLNRYITSHINYNGLPIRHGCFGLVQEIYRPERSFYFGLPYNIGFAEKYILDFNSRFKNIQLSLVNSVIYIKNNNAFGLTYKIKDINNTGEIKDPIEYDVIGIHFHPDYSEICQFHLGIFVAETTRLYCTQYEFLPAGLNKVESDFFLEAIKISNDKLRSIWGTITTSSFTDKINLDKVSWLDNPEKMNKVIVLGKKYELLRSYPGVAETVTFTRCPYPSYTSRLMDLYKE
jgi:hypothetical protein